MFLDEAFVEFKSGTGGSGAVSFHREKFVPRGGPNGADGGRGGDVILIADRGKRTLYDFKLKSKFEAQDGVHALGNKKGKDGKPIEIKVPVGTVITDVDLGETLVDLSVHGMKYRIAKGGRGGHGNQHYVNSVRQVPNWAEKGEPGEHVRVKLELKLLADVGLIGLPNAGKSTLLSRISAARPKIADYPFTTIVPNLGVVSVGDTTFVVADMPGLIEGASEGHGLGHQFLKHIERTRVLIHVVDAFPIDESDPIANFELIERELAEFSPEIADRPRLIALNKIDLAPLGEFGPLRQRFESLGLPLYSISGVTGEGIPALLHEAARLLESDEGDTTVPVLLPGMKVKDDEGWEAVEVEDGFELRGRRIRRMVAMTDLNSRDSVRYLHRRLERMGVLDKLREIGAEEGDSVFVDQHVFEFTDRA
ncbi:MAG TPA: GTPase ObgE [Fimbriimonadaceae bacterium]|nr:GTPase ObgE [Fimbriimonadaceae bacterium]HRJ33649.1 GTPase ObgE [Fimbriimonadaceae bacterium]